MSMIGYILILAAIVGLATVVARSADLPSTFLFWSVIAFCIITATMVALQLCDFLAIIPQFPTSVGQLFLVGQTFGSVVSATLQFALPVSLGGRRHFRICGDYSFADQRGHIGLVHGNTESHGLRAVHPSRAIGILRANREDQVDGFPSP